MDAKEATDKLNRIIHREKIEFPRYLYKYRPFDEHVWDMLDNDYLFLCPPKDLDDPSECQATLTFKDLYDWETNRLKKKFVEGIIAYIKPYMGPEDFKKVNEKFNNFKNTSSYKSINSLILRCFPTGNQFITGIVRVTKIFLFVFTNSSADNWAFKIST